MPVVLLTSLLALWVGVRADDICPRGYLAQKCGFSYYSGSTGDVQEEGCNRTSPCQAYCSNCEVGIVETSDSPAWTHGSSTQNFYCCDRDSSGSSLPLAWEPVHGGRGRACKSGYWDSQQLEDYGLEEDGFLYTTHRNISSLSDCESLCVQCDGVEHSPGVDGGLCKVWKLGTTPAETRDTLDSAPLPGSTCVKYNQQGIHFQPVHGGQHRACRRSHPDDNSAAFYQLLTGVETVFDCELRCVQLASCLGIEYNENGRCELWTELINSTKSVAGYTCMQVEEHWRAARRTTTTTATPRQQQDGLSNVLFP